jgi:hypothetical protein
MSTGHDRHQAELLLIDAAAIATGIAVALLLQANPWLAVPVGLAAYAVLGTAAMAVRRGRQHRDTP